MIKYGNVLCRLANKTCSFPRVICSPKSFCPWIQGLRLRHAQSLDVLGRCASKLFGKTLCEV